VNTIVWDHAKRLRSYELLAGEFGLGRTQAGRFVDPGVEAEGAYPRG
jgi:hypothetical protein